MKTIAKLFCAAVRFSIVPLLCLTLFLLPVVLLTACEDKPTAGMVRLKTESELRQIAQEECPPCTFVRMERKLHENICYFTDDACGFAFTIGSYAHKPKIGYIESTYNHWDQCYYDYIWDKTNARAEAIAKQAGFTLEKEDRPPIRPYAELYTDRTMEQIADGMIQLGHLVKSADVHHKYDRCELWAKHYDSEKDIWMNYAFYRFKDDVVDLDENKDIYYYMDNAEDQLGVKCIFDYKTQMKEGEIPGLSSWEYYNAAHDDRVINIYFFHTETGEKKLIAEFQVEQNVYYLTDAE